MLHICKQESMMKNAHLTNSRCDLAPPPFFSTRGPRVRPRGHVLLPCVGGMQYEEWRMRGIPMCSVSPPGPADDTRRYDGYIVNKIDIRLLCLVNSNLTWFWQWVEFRAYWGKKSYNFVHIYTGARSVHRLSSICIRQFHAIIHYIYICIAFSSLHSLGEEMKWD